MDMTVKVQSAREVQKVNMIIHVSVSESFLMDKNNEEGIQLTDNEGCEPVSKGRTLSIAFSEADGGTGSKSEQELEFYRRIKLV